MRGRSKENLMGIAFEEKLTVRLRVSWMEKLMVTEMGIEFAEMLRAKMTGEKMARLMETL